MQDTSITTTNGEIFTHEDHRKLAALLYRRWGKDGPAFCCAWRRLFENNADDSEILKLLPKPCLTVGCPNDADSTPCCAYNYCTQCAEDFGLTGP